MKHYVLLTLLAFALSASGCKSDPAPGPEPMPISDLVAENDHFRIEASNVTASTADVLVTPKDETMRYWMGFYSKSYVDEKYGGDVLNIAREMVDGAIEFCGGDTGEMLATTLNGVLLEGESFEALDELFPKTDMVAYAVGISLYGEFLTDALRLDFKTAAPPAPVMIDMTFEMTVTDITTTSANVKVKPSLAEQWYFYDLLEGSVYDRYMAQDGGGLAQYFADKYAELVAFSGENFYYYIYTKVLLRRGELNLPYNSLEGGKTYHLIACAVDEFGQFVTEFATSSFNTGDVPDSDMTFEVSVEEITSGGATFHVVPSNDQDPYYAVPIPASKVAGASDDEVVEQAKEVLDWYFDFSYVQGEKRIENTQLEPSTDYTLAVFGYDGGRTTPVLRKNFRTLDAGNPADCTFDITVDPKQFGMADLVIKPSDGTVLYFHKYLEASQFTTAEEQVALRKVEIEVLIQSLADSGSDMTVAEYVRGTASRGTLSLPLMNLQPETEYVVLAYAVNDDASNAGEVAVQRFTTPKEEVGTATVAITLADKFFNGDQLVALDPVQYAGFADCCVYPTSVRPSEDAAHWYVCLNWGDASDPTRFADAMIINMMMANASKIDDARECDFLSGWVYGASYSGQMTICGVAVDAEGKFGPVTRVLLPIVEKADCAPADQFVPAAERAGTQAAATSRTYMTLPGTSR